MIRAGARALVDIARITPGLGDLRILVASGALCTLGTGLLSPILPIHLERRGIDLERIGLVFTLGSLLPLVAQPALGALSDRLGRRRILLWMSLGSALLVPTLAMIEQPLLLASVLATRLLLDRSTAPIWGALMGDRVPVSQRATVAGLISSAVSLAFVTALVASAAGLALLGLEGLFGLAGALIFAGGLVLARLPDERTSAAPTPTGSLRATLEDITAPIGYVRRTPALIALFAYQFCFLLALDLFPLYIPLFAVRLGASQTLVGPLIAASWLVYAFVQPFAGRASDRQVRRKGLIAGGLIAMAVSAALLAASAYAPTPYALPCMAAVWVLMAIPDGLFRPAAEALVLDMAPAAERGRFLGALGSVGTLARIIAPLIYGIVARRVSIEAAFLISAAAFTAALAALSRVDEPSRSARGPVADLTTEAE